MFAWSEAAVVWKFFGLARLPHVWFFSWRKRAFLEISDHQLLQHLLRSTRGSKPSRYSSQPEVPSCSVFFSLPFRVLECFLHNFQGFWLHLEGRPGKSVSAGFFPSCASPFAIIACVSWFQLFRKDSCVALSSFGSPRPWVPGILFLIFSLSLGLPVAFFHCGLGHFLLLSLHFFSLLSNRFYLFFRLGWFHFSAWTLIYTKGMSIHILLW